MKRKYVLLLLLALSFGAFAQHHENCNHAKCAIEGTGIDEFTFVPPPASFVPGAERDAIITVTYTGFTPEAEAAFQYAVDIWASILTSNVPILINANWTDIPGNTLGFAGAAGYEDGFPGSVAPNIVYPVSLADKIAGANLNGGAFDINATFDSGTTWYLGTDGNTPGGQYDFVSVVLHELCHGLGMLGSSAIDGVNGDWQLGGNFFLIYDTFVENGSQTAVTTFADGTVALADQFQSDDLFWNGASAVTANGGLKPKLYAPATYQQGSSFSHLNETTYPAGNPNSLMTPFIGAAEAIHDPGALQIGIMEDIGWTVTVNTVDDCIPTGVQAQFDCVFNDAEELVAALVVGTFFTGDCFVDEVCVQEIGGGSPECYALQDFDIFLTSGQGVILQVNPNSSYQVWFAVDGETSEVIIADTGACVEVEGCTNPYAANYNPLANIDDDSCTYNQTICDCLGREHTIGVLTWLGDGFEDDGNFEWDGQLVSFNCADWGYDCGDIEGSPSDDPYGVCSGNLPPNNGCSFQGISGCTNDEASNFNPSATIENGTCTYPGCDVYIDFEEYGNGEFIALNSDLITTWSGDEGDLEDAVAQIGNASSGQVAMLIQQTIIDGGPDDIIIPFGVNSGQYNLNLDMYVYPEFGGYYNVQETTTPGDGWAFEVYFNSNGVISLFQDEELLFNGNYTPGQWLEVTHDIDLDNNILLLSVGTIVEFPITFDTSIGSLNFFAFGGEDTGLFLVDNISLCGSNEVPGCTDLSACNYNADATFDDDSCEYLTCAGCTDLEACNYDETASIDDDSCEYLTCAGCTDSEACNYDETATFDDGTCDYLTCAGCTDELATNYNPDATFDNGSCLFDFFICDCLGNQWPPNFRFELGDGIPNTGAFQANFDCEDWGYDCGDIDGSPSLDPYDVCDGGLPPNNGCEVGVDEFNDSNWTLYPNPSDGNIFLSYSGLSNQVQIRILDIEGRSILESRTFVQSGEVLRLNETKLSQGSYFLQVISEKSIVNKHFIVK